MLTGECKFWNDERGYGFLKRDDGAADAFCHASGLAGSSDRLVKGQRVSFEIGTDRKSGRERAQDVRVI